MRDLLTVLGIDKVDRGRPQLRRRRGDAVRLPVPRAHRAAGAGRARRPRPRGHARRSGRSRRPGFHQADGRADAARHPARSASPACARWPAPAPRAPATSTRSPTIFDSFKDPQARGARSGTWSRAVVDWRGQIVTMADRAYLTEAMPMCVIWGSDDAVIPVRHAEHRRGARARRRGRGDRRTPGTSRTRTTRSGSSRSSTTFIRTTQPATYHREPAARALLAAGRRRPGQTRSPGARPSRRVDAGRAPDLRHAEPAERFGAPSGSPP